MDDRSDQWVQNNQNRIKDEIEKHYGEKAFLPMMDNIPHMGSMPDPDGHASLKGICGDTMEVFLKFRNDRVREASFRTDGCRASAVCGSCAAEMCIGKTPDDIVNISGEAILGLLKDFLRQEEHCAFLAAETVQEALSDYMIRKRRTRRRKE